METLAKKVERCASAPYVYTYPTTRAFAPVKDLSAMMPVFTREVNLYVHIPFCEQKCTFCGYLTTVTKSAAFQDAYVDCVVREIGMARELLRDKIVKTVNFGGGTPSLLTVEQFGRIMEALIGANPGLRSTAEEISIEATPESVIAGKIAEFRRWGLDRVSMGVQSLDDREIRAANRRNTADQSVDALTVLKEEGIVNVCVDLMYGLAGQHELSWRRSVNGIIALQPETVELYALAVIPGTPFAVCGDATASGRERLGHYAFARKAFLEAGYVQDCHVRFVRDRGGYLQQRNVFDEQSLIGFGAGARSYAVNMHYRNAFDAANHRAAIRDYMETVMAGKAPVRSMVVLTDEERLRRHVIYRLECLDTEVFARTFGQPFRTVFAQETEALLALGLAEEDGTMFRMTPKGLAFRDIIANEFFSEASRGVEVLHWIRKKA